MQRPKFDRVFAAFDGTAFGILETGDGRYSSWYEWFGDWHFYRDIEADSQDDAVEQVCLLVAGFIDETITI